MAGVSQSYEHLAKHSTNHIKHGVQRVSFDVTLSTTNGFAFECILSGFCIQIRDPVDNDTPGHACYRFLLLKN